MFDLEQAIADWRQGMLDRGIGSPVPLEELENHLREDIERRIEAGTSEQMAFETTVTRMGRGDELKKEFVRAGGWASWLGNDRTMRVNRIFGVLWFGYCSWSFAGMAWTMRFLFSGDFPARTSGFFVGVLALVIFGSGIYGSIRLA
jgi:hypothetical protein